MLFLIETVAVHNGIGGITFIIRILGGIKEEIVADVIGSAKGCFGGFQGAGGRRWLRETVPVHI